jgi:hypothetical protein
MKECLGQIGEVDEIGKVERASLQALQRGDHLGGNDLARALHQAQEVVHKVVRLTAPQLLHKLLQTKTHASLSPFRLQMSVK